MNTYVTSATIKRLREMGNFTQADLADRVGVSSKTISKWETGKGLPDISLLQPLAQALGISVIELMNGEHIINRNVSANMQRSLFYVCPVCGNAVHALGNTVVSCCGITLPALEAEEADEDHAITIENVEDEHFFHRPPSHGEGALCFLCCIRDFRQNPNGKALPGGKCRNQAFTPWIRNLVLVL